MLIAAPVLTFVVLVRFFYTDVLFLGSGTTSDDADAVNEPLMRAITPSVNCFSPRFLDYFFVGLTRLIFKLWKN